MRLVQLFLIFFCIYSSVQASDESAAAMTEAIGAAQKLRDEAQEQYSRVVFRQALHIYQDWAHSNLKEKDWWLWKLADYITAFGACLKEQQTPKRLFAAAGITSLDSPDAGAKLHKLNKVDWAKIAGWKERKTCGATFCRELDRVSSDLTVAAAKEALDEHQKRVDELCINQQRQQLEKIRQQVLLAQQMHEQEQQQLAEQTTRLKEQAKQVVEGVKQEATPESTPPVDVDRKKSTVTWRTGVKAVTIPVIIAYLLTEGGAQLLLNRLRRRYALRSAIEQRNLEEELHEVRKQRAHLTEEEVLEKKERTMSEQRRKTMEAQEKFIKSVVRAARIAGAIGAAGLGASLIF